MQGEVVFESDLPADVSAPVSFDRGTGDLWVELNCTDSIPGPVAGDPRPRQYMLKLAEIRFMLPSLNAAIADLRVRGQWSTRVYPAAPVLVAVSGQPPDGAERCRAHIEVRHDGYAEFEWVDRVGGRNLVGYRSMLIPVHALSRLPSKPPTPARIADLLYVLGEAPAEGWTIDWRDHAGWRLMSRHPEGVNGLRARAYAGDQLAIAALDFLAANNPGEWMRAAGCRRSTLEYPVIGLSRLDDMSGYRGYPLTDTETAMESLWRADLSTGAIPREFETPLFRKIYVQTLAIYCSGRARQTNPNSVAHAAFRHGDPGHVLVGDSAGEHRFHHFVLERVATRLGWVGQWCEVECQRLLDAIASRLNDVERAIQQLPPPGMTAPRDGSGVERCEPVRLRRFESRTAV